jgi:hypothetical protein
MVYYTTNMKALFGFAGKRSQPRNPDKLVAATLSSQRPALFDLADEIVASIPEGGWKYVIADGAPSFLSGGFIFGVLSQLAQRRGGTQPSFLMLANSPRVRDDPDHIIAVRNYLRDHGVAAPDRALVVAQRVTTGGGLERLGAHMMHFGVAPDYAIVCNQIGDTAEKTVRELWSDSEVFQGGLTDVHSSELSRILGFETTRGEAVPTWDPIHASGALRAAHGVIGMTVAAYSNSRFDTATP